jgi:hypothetical protein
MIYKYTYHRCEKKTLLKTLLQDEFIETADKIINVTVEGLRITTADVSVPEKSGLLSMVKVRALVVVSVSGSVALRVPIKKSSPLLLARAT